MENGEGGTLTSIGGKHTLLIDRSLIGRKYNHSVG